MPNTAVSSWSHSNLTSCHRGVQRGGGKMKIEIENMKMFSFFLFVEMKMEILLFYFYGKKHVPTIYNSCLWASGWKWGSFSRPRVVLLIKYVKNMKGKRTIIILLPYVFCNCRSTYIVNKPTPQPPPSVRLLYHSHLRHPLPIMYNMIFYVYT